MTLPKKLCLHKKKLVQKIYTQKKVFEKGEFRPMDPKKMLSVRLKEFYEIISQEKNGRSFFFQRALTLILFVLKQNNIEEIRKFTILDNTVNSSITL